MRGGLAPEHDGWDNREASEGPVGRTFLQVQGEVPEVRGIDRRLANERRDVKLYNACTRDARAIMRQQHEPSRRSWKRVQKSRDNTVVRAIGFYFARLGKWSNNKLRKAYFHRRSITELCRVHNMP